MYIPKLFEESDISLMHALMRAYPLATLITQNEDEIVADVVPFVLQDQPLPFGALHGHVARVNPLWQKHPTDKDVLIIFQGENRYISPSWYASKPEHGRVVPTWNYTTVHVYGRLHVIEDAQWLRAQVEALTIEQEKNFSHPWGVDDAPADYVSGLLKAIVGIEIVISDLKGKWKVSQNRSFADKASVAANLRVAGDDQMASLVEGKKE